MAYEEINEKLTNLDFYFIALKEKELVTPQEWTALSEAYAEEGDNHKLKPAERKPILRPFYSVRRNRPFYQKTLLLKILPYV